jgi:glutathione synthase/RimK-type ligase-like ATP-grasp enzyme
MNVVFLSPYFPPNYRLFCLHLHRLGARVLGLGDAPYDSLRPELQAALTEYYRVGNLHNYDELRRALQHFQRRWGRIDRIESHNEHWLETQARLRTELGIPGVQADRIADAKRKSRMKQIFRRANIPVARGLLVRGLEEARGALFELDLPLVAKPDIGVGATGTKRIDDERQLEELFSSPPSAEMMLEEYIQGRICTYDGLVDREGRVVYRNSLMYSEGVMEVVNADRHIHYHTLREIPEDLEELGRRTLEAFSVRESFFHFEFFRTEDGRLVALEVNLRPPGSPTLDMFDFASDIDLYREWSRIVVLGSTDLQYSHKYFCGYIGRKDKNRYRHTHEEVVQRLAPILVNHQRHEPIFARAMGDYFYLVRSPQLEEVLEAAAYGQELA